MWGGRGEEEEEEANHIWESVTFRFEFMLWITVVKELDGF